MFGWYIYFYCTISGCHPVSYSELCPATLSVSDMCCSLSALLIFAMPWKKSSTWHAWKIKLKAIRLTWQHPSSKVAMHSVGVSAVIEPPIRGGSDSRETPRSRISGEEDRCSGGGGGEGGVLNNFAPAGLLLLLSVIWQPMQARLCSKHLANDEIFWFYDLIVIKWGHQKEDRCRFRRCIKRHQRLQCWFF